MLHVLNDTENILYGLMQCLFRPLVFGNHSFPVPLIYINTVQVIGLFISTNGVHIRIESLAFLKMIAFQSQSFPLRERLNHFNRLFRLPWHVERHRPLHTV